MCKYNILAWEWIEVKCTFYGSICFVSIAMPFMYIKIHASVNLMLFLQQGRSQRLYSYITHGLSY